MPAIGGGSAPPPSSNNFVAFRKIFSVPEHLNPKIKIRVCVLCDCFCFCACVCVSAYGVCECVWYNNLCISVCLFVCMPVFFVFLLLFVCVCVGLFAFVRMSGGCINVRPSQKTNTGCSLNIVFFPNS